MRRVDPLLARAEALLSQKTPPLSESDLRTFVKPFIQGRDRFLRAADTYGSPLYIIETAVLKQRVEHFHSAFDRHIPELTAFYAMKSNNHPAIVKTVVEHGMGLDASSGLELEAGLNEKPQAMIFSGPGKTEDELRMAVEHADRVTVMLDSFGELRRLEGIASRAGRKMRAGVRLMTQEKGLWRKFGIELKRLDEFTSAAGECSSILLEGIQFHTSWNLSPVAQTRFIRRLGGALSKLPGKNRERLRFLDIGGGFWPERGEWLHSTSTPEGRIRAAIQGDDFPGLTHHRLKSAPIEVFAEKIGKEIDRSVRPLIDCRLYAEPGRWICNDALHILIRVVDRKAQDLVITDAGTNAVGWERFESDYFPLINLTRPSLTERRCRVLGSLCTPHDVWGYAYFGKSIEEGDLLLVPTQGAYTWGLRQRFIKPLPASVIVDACGESKLWKE